ncbi:MAG: hypothetical protein AAGI91_04280 [Bacteroidota bacterium]
MTSEQIVEALEAAITQLGVAVRRERGSFRGGLCTVGGEQVVVLNKRTPVEAHLAILADALRRLPADEVYLRPAVRDAVEAAWVARDAGVGAEIEEE